MEQTLATTWQTVLERARRRQAAWHLHRSMAHLPDAEIDRRLRVLGRRRRDLFTAFAGNARHRNRMARMMVHFGVDLDRAVARDWPALRAAERACAGCASRGRCASWCAWATDNDAPRVFCPNAALFDALAQTRRAPAS